MKRASLIGGAVAATTIILFSVVVSSANPSMAVLPTHNYVEATFAARFPPPAPDLVLALSDLVDIERVIKESTDKARARHQAGGCIAGTETSGNRG